MRTRWFTQEEIAEMERIPLKDFCEKIGYKVLRHSKDTYQLAEHDSLILFTKTNTFCRFSTGRGGKIFDLAKELWGSDFYSTAQALYTMYFGKGIEVPQVKVNEVQEKTKKEFKLPAFSSKVGKMVSYLRDERHIPLPLIQEFYKKNLLRETTHNEMLFIGYEEGQPAYAFKRGTGKKEKFSHVEIAGSRKEIGFKYLSEDFLDVVKENGNQHVEVYVFEACIDLMSYKAFLDAKEKALKAKNPKYQAPPYALISLGGLPNVENDKTEHNALVYFLEKYFDEYDIDNVHLIFCLDNDDKGREATEKYIHKFSTGEGYSCRKENKLYQGYKDVNEWLCKDPNALKIKVNQLEQMITEKRKYIENSR